MKRLLPFLLLLAGCGSQDEPQNGGDGPTPAEAALLNVETGERALTPAELQARASEALRPALSDPAGARFSNLRNGSGGAVCGLVDVREGGRYSGARPFLVAPDGAALISPTAEIGFGDPVDIFPDFYIRWCATPEELQRLGPEVTAAEAVDEQAPELPEAEEGAAPAAPPPAPAPPQPRTSPPRPAPQPAPKQGDDDSFLNAVLRKDDGA